MHPRIYWRVFFIATILAGLLTISTQAQQTNTRYELFTVDEGLPQNYVSGLAQDSAGFIWIGTKDGLARYDGHNFKIYRRGKDSLYSPADNYISNLYADHRGNIWIQYNNRAIDRFHPATGIFEHISRQKNWEEIRPHIMEQELIVDRLDNLWLLTDKGFYRYRIDSNQLSAVTRADGLAENIPRGILEDHAGKIWMVTQTHFYVYDHSNGRTQTIPFTLSARQTYSGRNYKFGIGETESGKIIVTSLDTTTLVYDAANKTFHTIVLRTRKALVYDSGVGNTNPVKAHNGDRWFTGNGRIFRMDKRTDEITEIADPTHPTFPNASALLIDRSGNAWFGKNAQGLCKINLEAPRFVSKKYTQGNFETDILVNELGVHPQDLPADFGNPAFGYIYRNAIDTSNGLLWIQNYLFSVNVPRLLLYDVVSKKMRHKNISQSPDGAVGIDNDHPGSAWFIGINNWRPYRLTKRNGTIETEMMELSSTIPDSLFRAGKVAINPVVDNNVMWIMASNASIDFGAWTLVSIDLITKQIRCYPVTPDNAEPSSSLLMMVNDPSNPKYLWIGSTGNGLIRFDKTSGQSHCFTTDQGLANNTIYSIIPDKTGNLWMSSNKGITRFNPVTHAVRNFDITDGLISNEFNRWHCFRLPDGRIAFGGVTGYTIFHPDDIREDAFQPRVLLSNLLINNKALPDSAGLSAGNLDALNKLVLPYYQNFLSFEFASDEYNVPRKINYRYRLANFDHDWVYAPDRTANYTRLPPGNYTLEINASNVSGIWSSQIKTLQIVIAPPWWQTWWAYTMYILLAALLIAGFFYYRLRQLRLQQEMILQQQQTEQLKAIDEMKSRFFSNITHEFRTPLSLIISPVEKLQGEIKDEQARVTLSSVQRNAQRLLHLINQLLDLSKLETGKMSLSYSRGRLDEFIQEMVELFRPLAASKKIDLTGSAAFSHEYLFEADKLKTVLFNLLSNAIKFTPAGGAITISGVEEEGKIKIAISDTGIGIAADKLPFIFDRFFQADDSRTRAYEGTGIGLALVKELIELMNGSVIAESRQHAGTRITVIFPAEKAGDSIAPLWQRETIALVNTISETPQEHPPASPDLPLLLLVEDNEELLSFLKESFERNFRVLTAQNRFAAINIAREELPDVVISDIMMPEMDGYSLCSKLKTDPVTSHIAVILLSAKASYESRLEGLQLGADDYISKPFHFDELETRIHNLLERQEKLRIRYRSQLQKQDNVAEMNGPENRFLKNIYAIIEEMIDDPQLGASKLAEKNAMSLRTLNRKLNALLGLTAGDLIRQYRLQKSLALLKAGHNVSEAAYSVGFETPAYFSQCFKEQYGVSPRDYFAGAH